MCWGYDGFVLAHKDVNPKFDKEKPFIIVIDQDGVWQMHFENFSKFPKNEKVLDDMYKAVSASCEKGMELRCAGGATPGGLSGISKLQDYGFKKVFLPGEITAGNTKPRPFKMVEKGYNKMKGIDIRDLNEDRLIGIKYKCPPFGKVLDSIKREADVKPSSGVYVTVKDLVKDGYYWPIEGITKSSIRMNAVCLDGYGKKTPKVTISLKDLERAFKQFGDRNAGCVLSRDFWGIDDYYLPHETGGVFSYMLIENRDNKDQPDILLITDSIEFSPVYDGEKDKFDISRFRQMDDDPPPNANVSATKDGQYRSSAERRMPLRAMSE